MSPDDQSGAAAPSLVDSLKTYIDDVPEDERADALHGVFYGFYRTPSRRPLCDRGGDRVAAIPPRHCYRNAGELLARAPAWMRPLIRPLTGRARPRPTATRPGIRQGVGV
jgi:hypothetical protein